MQRFYWPNVSFPTTGCHVSWTNVCIENELQLHHRAHMKATVKAKQNFLLNPSFTRENFGNRNHSRDFLEKFASFFLKTAVKLNNSGTVSTSPKLQGIAAPHTVHPSHICRILTTRWTLGGRPLMYWFSLHPAVLLQLHNYCISSAWVCCRLHAISRTCQPVFIAFPKKPSMRLMDFNRSLACNQTERSFSTKVTRFYHEIKVKISGEGLSF